MMPGRMRAHAEQPRHLRIALAPRQQQRDFCLPWRESVTIAQSCREESLRSGIAAELPKRVVQQEHSSVDRVEYLDRQIERSWRALCRRDDSRHRCSLQRVGARAESRE